jgi:hypothetical protein
MERYVKKFKESLKVGSIEVYPKDAPKKMTWNTANKYCKSLGEGWRLPTKQELNLMYTNLHKKRLGGFANDAHWSSSEYGFDFAWLKDFLDGTKYYTNKNRRYRVRAVR